jgi:hypothetical protein
MYAKLEEDFGLARRSMAIFDRATQVVADEDKFEVCLAADLYHCILRYFTDVLHLHCQSNC